MWPAPKGSPIGPDFARAGREGSGGDDLVTAVARNMFPMPTKSMMTAADMELARFAGNDPRRPSYSDATRLFPTPNATDGTKSPKFYKGGNPSLPCAIEMSTCDRDANGSKVGSGQLNPDWVEWLMGFPVGWTDLECDDPVHYNISVEPDIPRVATGKKARCNRLQCLGNAVVPQCAQYIGDLIMEALKCRK